ncbi:unnamed protein product [Calypogeia fissa]
MNDQYDSGFAQDNPTGENYDSSQAGGGYGGDGMNQSAYGSSGVQSDTTQEKKDTRREDEAGLGGLAAGADALYERHEVKADPEHAGRHKLEEEVAGGGAVAAEGGAVYERHEKKDEEQQIDDSTGEKKHGWF